MKAAIVVFPGTNRERDMAIALRRVTGQAPRMIWHHETDLSGVDLVVLPGGFSYGDYLRCGAMAAHSPIMRAVRDFAAKGGHILGVCNGFQILTESNLLPGALLRNADLRFLSQDCHLRVEVEGTPFTRRWKKGDIFRTPLAHGDGNYTADAQTLAVLEGEGRVAFRYADAKGRVCADDRTSNPNGSVNSIAGVLSENKRICGMMPHPEDLVDPLMGGEDGLPLFEGLVEALVR
ncbi:MULTISPECIES: phosphoribosylformylglycinamidine synthase subunit PurQ [Acetobacter]|jgi:phosphoribosylformylglycinamidine synthase|uniref:Phosphoribosylformylglycinamidine synthase subunit PurQ n=1 Tax=Acetobacter lovaniensis TaxID=104100 RepID=A0A841QAW1_9PROT|nr:phosphoribosylformylglycinamidine synthase subunit PurQ [Acetobacter lovaniensis]MBB6455525.1 phosphoribosylformylglycinamidine synthase [Acetobacter lovaniensis]MCI1697538.1 phosphoribosylformylglycinamidine synthase subunit PurQ [Acetobacter lovaniensis]MCP1238637.1 phosphoribosylformylglycinamidine synthase subunit PurQ [Acetobacter lovaniensis]NHN79929.1 phosphoribosylformylglycinamidine synthase subunit PurQ [Acetobacter lovaniensis]GBQ69002.1 phosphoribosylformylglycinamidine synthase